MTGMLAHARQLSLDDWSKLLTIVALVCGALLFLYRKLFRPRYERLKARLQRIWKAIDSVELIRKEVFPNGKGSMRDAVDRTEKMMKGVTKDVSMSIAQNRSLAEQSNIGMLEGDEDGEVTWGNRALRQMCGLRLDQITGSGWINAVHDDERRRVENEWRLATQNMRPFISTFRFAHVGTGTISSVHCEATPVFTERDRCAGWIATFRARAL